MRSGKFRRQAPPAKPVVKVSPALDVTSSELSRPDLARIIAARCVPVALLGTALAVAPSAYAVQAPAAPLAPDYRERVAASNREMVFIDPQVTDYERLQAALPQGLETVVLNADEDGLAQISAYLKSRPSMRAVHILSHGAPGRLQLGNGWLTSEQLATHQMELSQWFSQLALPNSPRPDILIYGCDVAKGEAGRKFVKTFSALTHADVAASTDTTGASEQQANWDLEFHTGTIETAQSLVTGQVDYPGTLATFTVTNTNSVGPGSLRQAVLDANNMGTYGVQDTIVFDNVAGVIDLSSVNSFGELTITGPVYIDGPGRDVLTVSGDNASRIFNITGAEGGDVTIEGLTIDGGLSSGDGGGIRAREDGSIDTVTVKNSTVSNSRAARGGGIAVIDDGISLVVENSIVSGNTAIGSFTGKYFDDGVGGGIAFVPSSSPGGNGGPGVYYFSGDLTITDSSISGNSSLDEGGGVYAGYGTSSSTVSITGSTIYNNNSGNDGGGVYVEETFGTITIANTTISNNSASSDGGGFATDQLYGDATLRITDSTITNNVAGNNGGGLYLSEVDNYSTAVVANSTISGNSAGSDGGGLFVGLYEDSSFGLLNSTVANNSAGSDGGGIMLYADGSDNYSTAVIANSTISGNSSDDKGGGIAVVNQYEDTEVIIGFSTITQNYAGDEGGGLYAEESYSIIIGNSIVSGNSSGGGSSPDLYSSDGNFYLASSLIGDVGSADTVDVGGNIYGADPLLEPLTDNGGPTNTHAILTCTSPAVDTADPTGLGVLNLALVAAGLPPDTDQRGPGFPRVNGPSPDMGAFETACGKSTSGGGGSDNKSWLERNLGISIGGVDIWSLLALGLFGLWRRLRRRPDKTA